MGDYEWGQTGYTYEIRDNPRWRWWTFWRPRQVLTAIYHPVTIDCSGLAGWVAGEMRTYTRLNRAAGIQ